MFSKKTQAEVLPTYYNVQDLQMGIDAFLESNAKLVDIKLSTDEVLIREEDKDVKKIAYHAIIIYKV